MTNRVTMADIARAAGVSPSTVSRALSDSPSIPEATRLRIQRLAAELDYRLDQQARNFRLRRSGTIATLFPYQGPSRRQISDPFYLEIVGAITDELDQHGYDTLIARVNLADTGWPGRYILDKRVDGLLLVDAAVDDSAVAALQALDARFVVWGAAHPDGLYTTVGCDSVTGAGDAVAHLARLGRRRIGFIGGFRGMVETDARWRGYLAGMQGCGLMVDEAQVRFTDFTPEAAGAAVRSLLDGVPDLDALFVCSDYMAVAAMEMLRRMGRVVPRDVAVVGFDDIPLAAHCSPRLTTIRQPVQRGGRMMVRALLETIDGRPPSSMVLPHQLVVRDSCGALP